MSRRVREHRRGHLCCRVGLPWLTLTRCADGNGNGKAGMELLAGLWRLIYSSGFASNNGGTRLLPAQLGQVRGSLPGRLCLPIPCAGAATLERIARI